MTTLSPQVFISHSSHVSRVFKSAHRTFRSSSKRFTGTEIRSRSLNGTGEPFKQATTEDEWLQLDAKVNTYPSARTFKAIGTGGQDFVDSMVDAVQRATNQMIDRESQVSERPSKEGSYLAVSIRRVQVNSGREVLSVYREMKFRGGSRLRSCADNLIPRMCKYDL